MLSLHSPHVHHNILQMACGGSCTTKCTCTWRAWRIDLVIIFCKHECLLKIKRKWMGNKTDAPWKQVNFVCVGGLHQGNYNSKIKPWVSKSGCQNRIWQKFSKEVSSSWNFFQYGEILVPANKLRASGRSQLAASYWAIKFSWSGLLPPFCSEGFNLHDWSEMSSAPTWHWFLRSCLFLCMFAPGSSTWMCLQSSRKLPSSWHTGVPWHGGRPTAPFACMCNTPGYHQKKQLDGSGWSLLRRPLMTWLGIFIVPNQRTDVSICGSSSVLEHLILGCLKS